MSTDHATDLNIDNLVRTARAFADDILETPSPTVDSVLFNMTASLRNMEAARAATIERAREMGATWAQIASSLGITKQAAQQRYGR